jgi:hypothetical protein
LPTMRTHGLPPVSQGLFPTWISFCFSMQL